ncbi:MAG: ATP-grasp domain-containing protein [Aequorivita sp.]
MKKLLLLGGLRYLIPIIKSAREMGLYVITCDNLPDNIAHQYADEYYNVSIIDKEAVLSLAKKLEIDGIMSFAVDPGVITAAYVCEKLNLPCAGPYKSIEILQNKGLFREFLERHQFNVPKARCYSNLSKALQDIDFFELPVIVKPVDSAGSKGVSKVENREELDKKIKYALKFSPSKEFIIEDFIEQEDFSSDSDCFSVDGNLVFCSFSNQRFDASAANPYTPSAYSWPSTISLENQNYLQSELERLIKLLEMKTSIYNIEVRVGKNGSPYIMEVSPRGGGNRISEILKFSTSIDLIENTIRASVGMPTLPFPKKIKYHGYWAEQILYSSEKGRFKEFKIDAAFKDKFVYQIDLWVSSGDRVKSFTGANQAIGTLIMKFNTLDELEHHMQTIEKYTGVILEY